MVRRVRWWPWQRRPATETGDAGRGAPTRVTPPVLLAAVQAVQVDIRRLGSATVRAETQTQGLATRLDAMGAQIGAGLEQLTRQAGRIAEATDVAATERARVLTRFFDLGDALARAQAALEQPAPEETRVEPEVAAILLRQRGASAEAVGRIRAQFVRNLADFGCEPVAAPGIPFDPRVHRAIARVEHPGLAGRVAFVAREGWLLDGRLLRTADVVVAVEGAPGGTPDPGEEDPREAHRPPSAADATRMPGRGPGWPAATLARDSHPTVLESEAATVADRREPG